MKTAWALACLLMTCAARGASAASPAAVSCPDYGPLPDAPADYAQAVARFAEYRAGKEPGIRAEGDLPFLRVHGGPTAQAVLLVHGLTDSPYYVATIGDALYARGFNVVSVLLPGHGTRPECLLHINKEQWRSEVRFGLSLARRLGARVSMAGFSTGGALSLDALAENFERSDRDPISWGNLLLFSPAIGFNTPEVDLCDIPGVDDVLEAVMPWKGNNPNAPETNPYRYEKMATQAVCQLVYLTQDNALRRWSIDRDIARRGVGVFAVESMDDTTVSPQAVVRFMDDLPYGARSELITYPKSDAVAHADVPRPETNPHYADMISRMGAFLEAPSASAAFVPPLPPPAPASAAILRRAQGLAGALAR